MSSLHGGECLGARSTRDKMEASSSDSEEELVVSSALSLSSVLLDIIMPDVNSR